MKTFKLREMSRDELQQRILELQEEVFNLRFASATRSLDNPLRLRAVRREMARIRTILNGQTMQEDTTAEMIFDVPELISFLSQDTLLPPGTVILTGTPPGVGFSRRPPVWLKPGDEAIVEIEKIGRLVNPVARA